MRPAWLLLFCSFCTSAPKVLELQHTKDQVWVNGSTYQVLVTGEPIIDQIPYTLRRKKSCRSAEAKIPARLESLFPGHQFSREDKSIVSRVFDAKQVCTLVVHLQGLPKKVQ